MMKTIKRYNLKIVGDFELPADYVNAPNASLEAKDNYIDELKTHLHDVVEAKLLGFGSKSSVVYASIDHLNDYEVQDALKGKEIEATLSIRVQGGASRNK